MCDIIVDLVICIVVCQFGLYNVEVKEVVVEYGLWYFLDLLLFEICSIGGNIVINVGGLCCVKYGVIGDYVLGMQVVLVNGIVVWLGGLWFKDVVGFFLIKLFVGSEGMLGVIMEVML